MVNVSTIMMIIIYFTYREKKRSDIFYFNTMLLSLANYNRKSTFEGLYQMVDP